jgi:hypothetical protein
MLRGKLSIEDYLSEDDFEFPIFARRSCELQRTLHASGKTLLQVEPFLDRLGRIHDRFAAGSTPQQVDADPELSEVYAAERSWTAALLRYYEVSAAGAFDAVIEALKAFARVDAARGTVRDRLRADALAQLLPDGRAAYVEAGEVHFLLGNQLRDRLPATRRVRTLHLMDPVWRRLTGEQRSHAPGDELTLLYMLRPDDDPTRADLLAARSLIHVKILGKEELEHGAEEYPHTTDEIECNRLVSDLSVEQCQRLFEEIRALPTAEARARASLHRRARDRS